MKQLIKGDNLLEFFENLRIDERFFYDIEEFSYTELGEILKENGIEVYEESPQHPEYSKIPGKILRVTVKEDSKWKTPNSHITLLDATFGFSKMEDFLPYVDTIPKRFYRMSNKWNMLAEKWFFRGLKELNIKEKSGIDKTLALAHLKTVLSSFQPQHGHKIAGVAYLMSLWFDYNEGEE